MIPRTFVVPLDGSPLSERAVPVARGLAERLDGGVLLMTAPHRGPRRPKEYLAEVADRCEGVPVETIPSDVELPADAVLSIVEESGDRVVCMTSHGRGGLRWSILGSTAEDVLRRSERPVVLVGRHCRDDFLARGKYLTAAVDGSVSAEAIAPVALEWADGLGLAPVAAFVAHPLDVETAEHPEGVRVPIADAFGGSQPIDVKLLFNSYTAGALTDFADDLPAALIAVSAHGRSGLARVTLGSVTMSMVHQAACPLLVVPHTDPADPT